jgi:hypothetical protein
MSLPPTIDLEGLGVAEGAHLLVRRALEPLADGQRLEVRGTHVDLPVHLRAWCRAHGHRYSEGEGHLWVEKGAASGMSAASSERSGGPAPTDVVGKPPAHWGLAARGARVELGGPEPYFALARRDVVWADEAPKLYVQAAGSQWDPAAAVDWSAPIDHDEDVERAVVQVMTYLVENEAAALVVPARFLGSVHPHFREVVQLLAVQVADEARHIEIFTRRAQLQGAPLGWSSAGGRHSLQTLLDEPDFAVASFLLSVLGEGTFLSLLSFLERHGPDAVTRRVAQLALQDEARHVAFGMSHLRSHIDAEPSLRGKLAAAVERRHAALAHVVVFGPPTAAPVQLSVAMSSSTMRATSSGKESWGFQPMTRAAFDASPRRSSTSAGRK